jgi:hypothetical protein
MFKTRTTRRAQRGGNGDENNKPPQRTSSRVQPGQSILERAAAAAAERAVGSRTAPAPAPAGGPTTIQGLCRWRGDDTRDAALDDWKSKLTSNQSLSFLLSKDTLSEEEYETVIVNQDELFNMANQIIYEKIGTSPDTDESDILSQYNAAENTELYKSYIEDIGRLIFKGEVRTPSGNRDSTSKTKMERLITSDPTYSDKLIEILLNPERVRNQFIQVLAAFIIHQKKEDRLLESIKTISPERQVQAAEILANRYNSLVKANTLVTTSEDLRDGMVLTMPDSTAQSLYKDFWRCFVMRCIGKYYKKDNSIEDYKSDFTYNTQQFTIVLGYKNDADTYAFITAAIYNDRNTPLVAQLTGDYKYFAIHLMRVLEVLSSSQENAAPAE